jgi:hypothetical protein
LAKIESFVHFLNLYIIFETNKNKLEFIITIAFYLFFIFLLKKWTIFNTPFLNSWGYAAVFTIKVVIALFLWEMKIELFGDAYNYLKEAAMLNHVWKESPIDYLKLLTGFGENIHIIKHHLNDTVYWTNSGVYNDAKNTIRFNAIISILSFGKIYIHILWIAFITLIGLKSIYDTLLNYTSRRSLFLFLSIVLLPTVTFWGASFLKESFLIFGFGLFFKGCFSNEKLSKRIGLLLVGMIFLMSIKPYVFLCLIPCVLFFITWKFTKKQKGKWAILIVLSSLLLAISVAKIVFKNPVSILSRKQADFLNVGKGGVYFMNDTSFFYFKTEEFTHFIFENDNGYLQTPLEGEIIHFGNHRHEKHLFQPNEEPWNIYYLAPQSGSYIHATPIHESTLQLIKNIPEALINVIFRPVPSDPPYIPEKWLIILETWFILISILWGIARRPNLSNEQKNIIYSLTVFVVLLSLIIGWIVPVLGALVRYRIPITIALVFISWTLWQPRKKIENE